MISPSNARIARTVSGQMTAFKIVKFAYANH